MKLRVLLCLCALASFAAGQATQSAADVLHAGLAAMGGEDKIRALNTLHLESSVVRNELEQSERPEGPYILENDQAEEWRDLARNDWKRTVKIHVAMQPEYTMSTTVADGAATVSFDSQAGPGGGGQLQDASETLALSPERILITALASPDLRRLADLKLQSVPHQEVEFSWQGKVVRIFLNANTHLPTAVEWVTAYPFATFWSIWGDVTTRAYYSFWWLQNGIHYPLQKDVVRNGLPDFTETITKIDFNPSLAADTFTITPENRTASVARAALTLDDRAPKVAGATEIAPGIVFIAGSWNATFVRQEDGIVGSKRPSPPATRPSFSSLCKASFPAFQ